MANDATPIDRLSGLLRGGLLRGVGLVAVLAAIALAIGAAPAGGELWLGLGAAAALVAAAASLAVHGRFLRTGSAADGAHANAGALLAARLQALLAARLQALLAASLLIKLAVLGLALVALWRFGVKFEHTATFCVAYAAASLICQITSAGYVFRSLGARAAGAATAGPRESVADRGEN
ncbi:MAG: hypothetical protein KDE27_32555 [Planctomycetes bacterium]|nr:hypothetical protein [Planctomycetota bacterium]